MEQLVRIATFNVNGVNGRLPVLLRWLEQAKPDIVCLQELKAPQGNFPEAAIRDAGYRAVWHGQKSWNGVAILGQRHAGRFCLDRMFSLNDLDHATDVVRSVMPPTPQYAWPLLRQRFGIEVVVKHENHTPIGAFKVRGGLTYVERLKRERTQVNGIVSATRGNHGQSLAFAGRHFGLPVVVVVPQGNSVEKNAAMRAFGAEIVEHGTDFDDAKQRATELAEERGFEYVRFPSRPDRRCRDLCLGAVPISSRSGRCIRADWARLRDMRPYPDARPAWPEDRHRRRRFEPLECVSALVRRGAGGAY